MTMNRQVNTNFNKNSTEVVLVAIKPGVFAGRSLNVGDTKRVPRTEAKEILTAYKGLFKIKID